MPTLVLRVALMSQMKKWRQREIVVTRVADTLTQTPAKPSVQYYFCNKPCQENFCTRPPRLLLLVHETFFINKYFLSVVLLFSPLSSVVVQQVLPSMKAHGEHMVSNEGIYAQKQRVSETSAPLYNRRNNILHFWMPIKAQLDVQSPLSYHVLCALTRPFFVPFATSALRNRANK